jgi:hypothetical protein
MVAGVCTCAAAGTWRRRCQLQPARHAPCGRRGRFAPVRRKRRARFNNVPGGGAQTARHRPGRHTGRRRCLGARGVITTHRTAHGRRAQVLTRPRRHAAHAASGSQSASRQPPPGADQSPGQPAMERATAQTAAHRRHAMSRCRSPQRDGFISCLCHGRVTLSHRVERQRARCRSTFIQENLLPRAPNQKRQATRGG